MATFTSRLRESPYRAWSVPLSLVQTIEVLESINGQSPSSSRGTKVFWHVSLQAQTFRAFASKKVPTSVNERKAAPADVDEILGVLQPSLNGVSITTRVAYSRGHFANVVVTGLVALAAPALVSAGLTSYQLLGDPTIRTILSIMAFGPTLWFLSFLLFMIRSARNAEKRFIRTLIDRAELVR